MATDLDGTLLDPSGRLPVPAAAALRRAADVAVVVLVTARPPQFVRYLGELLPGTRAAICCNGATLFDLASDRIVEERCLDAPAVTRIAEGLRRRLPRVALGAVAGTTRVCEPGYLPGGAGDLARIEDALHRPVTKLMARCQGCTATQMREVAAPFLAPLVTLHVGSDEGPLEMTAPGVDKGTALARLAKGLGIGPAQVLAFGDMPGDIPMLTWAGVGVAVADAHPDVVRLADAVTMASHGDGVAEYLEELFDALAAERW